MIMIDIHIHILPGMDDGSSNLDESLAMADLAVRGGVHTIVATPHSNLTGLYRNYLISIFMRICSVFAEHWIGSGFRLRF